MKKITLIFLIVIHCLKVTAHNWTTEQILKANSAKDIVYLSPLEKEIIMYINLCRLYPKEFCAQEVTEYAGAASTSPKFSEYRKTLIKSLNNMNSTNALTFDAECYKNAKCFAKEQGEAGTIGHERIKCPNGNFAECISYGMNNYKDIVMQWLIDAGIANLGHRRNCLNTEYTKIGLSAGPHKKWGTCCVADFIW